MSERIWVVDIFGREQEATDWDWADWGDFRSFGSRSNIRAQLMRDLLKAYVPDKND